MEDFTVDDVISGRRSLRARARAAHQEVLMEEAAALAIQDEELIEFSANFCADTLGMRWDEVHEVAWEVLDSPAAFKRMCRFEIDGIHLRARIDYGPGSPMYIEVSKGAGYSATWTRVKTLADVGKAIGQ